MYCTQLLFACLTVPSPVTPCSVPCPCLPSSLLFISVVIHCYTLTPQTPKHMDHTVMNDRQPGNCPLLSCRAQSCVTATIHPAQVSFGGNAGFSSSCINIKYHPDASKCMKNTGDTFVGHTSAVWHKKERRNCWYVIFAGRDVTAMCCCIRRGYYSMFMHIMTKPSSDNGAF